jgi:hypothetical protein
LPRPTGAACKEGAYHSRRRKAGLTINARSSSFSSSASNRSNPLQKRRSKRSLIGRASRSQQLRETVARNFVFVCGGFGFNHLIPPSNCKSDPRIGLLGVAAASVVGSPRGLLPEAPTDPDVRVFPHPALRLTASLRDHKLHHAPACAVSLSARVSLIRLWSPMSPPSVPRTFPCAGAPFPPRGPSGQFPRFLSTVKHSDFLPPLPRRFVSFASRYRRSPRVLLPRAQGATPVGQGLFTGFPTPDSSTEATGPPRFLENPTMNVPCSSTPAGPLRSATTALRCCLPPFRRRQLPREQ